MVATVERNGVSQMTRQANCSVCLTRDCPLSGNADSPVNVCNTYREVNCAFCAVKNCAMNGMMNSPVMACDAFQILSVAN
jgi:hypothetical protein